MVPSGAATQTAGAMLLVRRTSLVVRAAVVALLTVACSMAGIGSPRSGAYPGACGQWSYEANRCAAIVAEARHEARIDEAGVAWIELLPFDQPQTLSGGQVAAVRFHLADGSTIDQDVWCVGVSFKRACNDVAQIQTNSGVDSDVPCSGEPPDGCATLPPEPDPSAIAAATPFRLDSLAVPLDHEGRYSLELGAATLPDGYLSERSFRITETMPDTFWIEEGVRLEIRPDVAGRPAIGSRYREPFDGPEPVTVYLVFEVTQLDSPSVLQVRDVVVR